MTSMVFTFEIDLAHADRGVYEQLSLRVAQHPSESDEFLIARVLAYCLEYTEGIEFSRGLCDADEPPVAVKDLTGALVTWIDVGTPSAERLHRASKAAARVVVYVHKDPRQWLPELAATTIHRRDELELYLLERPLVTGLASRLERRTSCALSVTDGEIFVAFPEGNLAGSVSRVATPARR